LRSAFLAKTDGSGVCPTGFNVPTEAQLKAEIDMYLPQALLWWQMFLFDVHLQVYPIGMNHHRMLDR
jgi:hypothetical protein